MKRLIRTKRFLSAFIMLFLSACLNTATLQKEPVSAHKMNQSLSDLMHITHIKERGNGREEEIIIDAADHHIFGTYITPKAEYDSVVLLLHGFGADRECGGMFTVFAGKLAEEGGMAAFRFDFAGRGASDLDYSHFDLRQGCEDVYTAYRWLKENHPGICHVYLLGHSMGGTIAVLCEAEHAGDFDGLITWAGALDLRVLYTDEMMQYAKENGTYPMYVSWLNETLQIPYRWFEESENLDLLHISESGSAPLMAAGGKLDTTVAAEDANRLVKTRHERRSKALIYEEGDHMFSAVRDQLYEDSLEFLKELQSKSEE